VGKPRGGFRVRIGFRTNRHSHCGAQRMCWLSFATRVRGKRSGGPATASAQTAPRCRMSTRESSAVCITHTSRHWTIRSPGPRRPVDGFPVLPGGALLPRLPWALRHLGEMSALELLGLRCCFRPACGGRHAAPRSRGGSCGVDKSGPEIRDFGIVWRSKLRRREGGESCPPAV
jgi:hypothetical protein